mgnify:CR=1 FL=1
MFTIKMVGEADDDAEADGCDAGAAVLVFDGELDADRFAAEVDRWVDDPERLASMAAAARAPSSRSSCPVPGRPECSPA